MKKLIAILVTSILTVGAHAQAPQKMSYQAVIRNVSNALVTSTPVGMRISIIQGSIFGPSVYVETQTPSTNANGLVSLEVGSGVVVSGTFVGIKWAAGPYFIKTETDPTGGTNYSIVGTNELMSVPYALFSANSANALVSGFSHYLGEVFNGGIVFEIYKGSDGLEHGLIVALNEQPLIQWQSVSILVNANRTWDGAYNTGLMTTSPAATYIATLGAGWYIPSNDELALLYNNRFYTNKACFTGGYPQLSLSSYYWSSTEYNAPNAYYFSFLDGIFQFGGKGGLLSVRGVRAF